MHKQFIARHEPITIVLMLMLAVPLSGCGSRVPPLPETYPVHGKVTDKAGKPVADALVQFRPERDAHVSTIAVTASDGTYSLVTKRDGLTADGAVAGPNRVTLNRRKKANGNSQADIMAKGQSLMTSTTFPTPYDVKPGDNEINLNVDQPRR